MALECLGNRDAAVCIELTKKFENIHRGSIEELIERFDGKKIKGEVTIVVAPPSTEKEMEEDEE